MNPMEGQNIYEFLIQRKRGMLFGYNTSMLLFHAKLGEFNVN